MSSCIATADRGSRKESFMKLLSELSIGPVFIISGSLLQAHHFLSKAFLNPAREDVIQNDAEREVEVGQDEYSGVDRDREEVDVGQPLANGANLEVGSEQVPDQRRGADKQKEMVELQSDYSKQIRMVKVQIKYSRLGQQY